jgi:hypothetical protein
MNARLRVVAMFVGVLAPVLLGGQSAAGQSDNHCPAGAAPEFVLGFGALHGELGEAMGAAVSCEYADPNGTGDTLQDTTTGLAFWRKSTNTPTFTNGWEHWAVVDVGMLTWQGAGIDPPYNAHLLTPWSPAARSRTSGCVSSNGRPDPGCTPGALDPRVTQDNIQATICVPGYTGRVRPPTSYTTPLKRQLMAAYGLADRPLAGFELDHLISLELGGSPRDAANLWPESWTGAMNARQKDTVENFLHQQVCDGLLALADAQRLIAREWPRVAQER